jgi:hypothetical protein
MTMQLIASTTVGSGGATFIEFTSIPQTGTDLVLQCYLRRDSTNESNGSFKLNGIGGSAYSGSEFHADHVTERGEQVLGTNAAPLDVVGFSDGSVNGWSDHKAVVLNYTTSTKKMILINNARNKSGTADNFTMSGAYEFTDTNPVTSLKIEIGGAIIAEYSVAQLYTITKGSDGIVGAS